MGIEGMHGLCDCDDGTFVEMGRDIGVAFDDDLDFVADVGFSICDRRSMDSGDGEKDARESRGD